MKGGVTVPGMIWVLDAPAVAACKQGWVYQSIKAQTQALRQSTIAHLLHHAGTPDVAT